MSVREIPALPGSSAIGRRGPVTTAAPDIRMPLGVIGTALPAAYGSHSVGRRGQVMVIDDLDIMGIADQGKLVTGGHFVVFRKDRHDGDNAGIVDFPFMVTSFNADYHTRSPFHLKVRKFGYTQKATPMSPAQDGLEKANLHGFFGFVNALVADTEAMIGLRYMDRHGAERQGLRKGAWGRSDGVTASNQTLLAAPGAGRFYRIRTIIIIACGGNASSERVTLGSNATAVNDPLKVWYGGNNQDRGKIVQVLTDLDIPCPENQPVTVTFTSGFTGRHSLIVGAEDCALPRQNFLNLTGDPQ